MFVYILATSLVAGFLCITVHGDELIQVKMEVSIDLKFDFFFFNADIGKAATS